MPITGINLQSPQSDLTPWTLTLVMTVPFLYNLPKTDDSIKLVNTVVIVI